MAPFAMGTPADGMGPLMDAMVLACMASYAQGMELLRIASAEHNYNLHMPSIAQIWKGADHPCASAAAHSGRL